MPGCEPERSTLSFVLADSFEESAVKALCSGLAALLLALGLVPSALAQGDGLLYVTVELAVKPGMSAEFVELITNAAPETREFDGCRYFAVLVDRTDPDKVLFYQIWDSRADLDAYIAWRNETGFGEKMMPLLSGPPQTRYFTLASD